MLTIIKVRHNDVDDGNMVVTATVRDGCVMGYNIIIKGHLIVGLEDQDIGTLIERLTEAQQCAHKRDW